MGWIAAATIGGALLSANSASNAADKQASATDKAVSASKEQYNQTRSDLAPYRDAGAAALSRLSALLGVDTGPANASPTDKSMVWKNPAWGQGYNDLVSRDPNASLAQFDAGWGITPGQEFQPAAPGDQPSNSPEFGSLLKDFAPSDLAADPIYKSSLDFATTQGERAINARRAATGSYDSGGALKELGQFDLGTASGLGNDAYSRFNNNKSIKYGMLTGLTGTGLSAAGATSNAGTANSVNLSNLYTGQGNAAAAAGIAGGNAISGGINSAISNYNSQNLLAQLTGGGARSIPNTTTGYLPT